MTAHDADFAKFVERLRDRLIAGAKTYGNSSFERPLVAIIGEIQEEALDIVGWGFIAWVRLERLRDRVARLEGQPGGSDG